MAKKTKRKLRKAAAVSPGMQKKSRRARRGLSMRIKAGGDIRLRHMGDEDRCVAILPGLEISNQEESVTMSDSNEPVWNKLAVIGSFKGHPAGPFEMTSETFAQIERNFKRDGIEVPFDYEHAVEVPVSESADKAAGNAIASGWIKDVQNRPDGLYGLVDWTTKARQLIKNKEMRYISPAIRFGAKDPKTGEAVGARLSSAALTQKPFLRELPPALASDSEYTAFLCSEISNDDIAAVATSPVYAFSEDEYLPKFRSILKLHDLADSESIIDKLDRLEELCELADGDTSATIEGVNLSDYITPLREFMRMPANTTLSDLLDAVADMVNDNESEGVEMSDTVSVATQKPTTPTAPVITVQETKPVMETITLSDHNTKLAEAVAAAVEKATAPLTLQLSAAEAAKTLALTEKAAAEAEVVKLTDQIKTRDAAVAAARVEEAFSTYKEVQKLTDKNKKQMALTLTSDPELFEELYPKVTPDKAIMLRTITASDTSASVKAGSVKVVPDLSKVLEDVKAKNPGLDYDKQFDMALKEHATLMAG